MADLSLPRSGTSRRDQKKLKNLPTRVGRRLDPRDPKRDKYSAYRQRVGRPRGRGVPGSKAGRNR